MSDRITVESRLADIVASKPAAARILDDRGIDYCCGGDRSLREALGGEDREAAALVSELEGLSAPADQDWRTRPITELIDFLEATHHVFTRRELATIDPLLQRVMRAHFRNHGKVLTEIHHRFGILRGELEIHLLKEEEVLFPEIRAGQADALAPLADMEREHDVAGQILHELRDLTGNFTPPAGVCETFRALYGHLEALSRDIHRHVHLENYILAPRVRER